MESGNSSSTAIYNLILIYKKKINKSAGRDTPISFSKLISGPEQLALTQIRDQLKTEYAEKNGYKLLRIRYDDNITDLLEQHIVSTKFD